jgi:dCTP diphosphatase
MDGGGEQQAAAAGKGVGEAAPEVTLEELRKRMDDFARERDWEQFHSPRNLLLAMVRRSPSWLLPPSPPLS